MRARFLLLFLVSSFAIAKELPDSQKFYDFHGSRKTEYKFGYKNREHPPEVKFQDAAVIFAIAAVAYPLTQPEIVTTDAGSFNKYRENFGNLVFDKDEPFWNYIVHPFTGSQMYLFYRARGYSRIESFKMTFISSALFEFTIEVYSEPASVQDLFNTPILGSLFGVGIENLSMYLLNSGSTLGRIFGHIINPCTLLWFYDGKMQLIPQIDPKGKKGGLTFVMDF